MPYLLLGLLTLGTGLGIGLGLSEAPTAIPPGVTVQLELANTHVVAGHEITGWLVFQNTGSPRRIGGERSCLPSPYVALTNGLYAPTFPVGGCFSTGTFTIRHGTERLHFVIMTYYTTCHVQPSTGGPRTPTTVSVPSCLPPGPNGAVSFPLLPAGRYLAKVMWEPRFRAPVPRPVSVTIVKAAGSGG